MTLRDYRLAAGLSQRQIASKIGVGHVMVCEMERGDRWIPPTRVAKIAKALGVSRDDIEKLRRVCTHCGGTGREP